MAPKSNAYKTADRLAEGKLGVILCEARDGGESLHAISLRLFEDYGISISVQTVANWLNELGWKPKAKKKAVA